jgi:hypothetical protein
MKSYGVAACAYHASPQTYQALWQFREPLSTATKIPPVSIKLYQVYGPYHMLHAVTRCVIAVWVFPDEITQDMPSHLIGSIGT